MTDPATAYIAYKAGIAHDEVPKWLDCWAETFEGRTAALTTDLKTFFSRGINLNFDIDHHDEEPTMTTTFTATNGIEIEISPDGYLLGKGDRGTGPTYATGGPEGIDALREYFQHERDTELGRWRDPEAPNYVVYPTGEEGLIRVLDEEDGNTWLRDEEDSDHHHRLAPNGVAARYFAAHPEPREWENSEAGELWAIHVYEDEPDGRTAIAHGDGTFTDLHSLQWRDHHIAHAERIWPKESRDE